MIKGATYDHARLHNSLRRASQTRGVAILVAVHQVLEKIRILRSSLYSISVHTYYVDGQLSSVKLIAQVTGELQAI